MKPIISLFLVLLLLVCTSAPVLAAPSYTAETDALGVILMDAKTGEILFEKNADEPLIPASVTKVMTMLLVFEAIDGGLLSYTDIVTVSDKAASMGGSQIFLAPGEKMSVDDLLKGLIIASGNDAAVALAEAVAGSEENFVMKMNERAAALGMKNTHFENTNGLDDTTENHVISARDLAICTRELLKHPKVLEYSSTWMDTIRDGAFGLTNTNRLIRFYDGATGLKTGSTSKAKFCISATAERGGLSLIAVIMGSSTKDARNALAKSLFDFGFASFASYEDPAEALDSVAVSGGEKRSVSVTAQGITMTVEKGALSSVEKRIDLADTVEAPIAAGQKLGTVSYLLNGEEVATADILADEAVARIDFGTLFLRMLSWFVMGQSRS